MEHKNENEEEYNFQDCECEGLTTYDDHYRRWRLSPDGRKNIDAKMFHNTKVTNKGSGKGWKSMYDIEYIEKHASRDPRWRHMNRNEDNWPNDIDNAELPKTDYQREYTEKPFDPSSLRRAPSNSKNQRSPEDLIKDLEGENLKCKDALNWHKNTMRDLKSY